MWATNKGGSISGLQTITTPILEDAPEAGSIDSSKDVGSFERGIWQWLSSRLVTSLIPMVMLRSIAGGDEVDGASETVLGRLSPCSAGGSSTESLGLVFLIGLLRFFCLVRLIICRSMLNCATPLRSSVTRARIAFCTFGAITGLNSKMLSSSHGLWQ